MAYSLHDPNKPSIVTSLSTMLLCTPLATPNVVMKVETKAFRLFVFSLKSPFPPFLVPVPFLFNVVIVDLVRTFPYYVFMIVLLAGIPLGELFS